MARFSESSKKKLNTCEPKLQRLCYEAINIMDFTVLCGHRGKEEQDKAVAEGKSKTPYPNSKHNSSPSKAVDLAPYPIDWNDRERFVLLIGIIKGLAHAYGIKIRCGADFNGDMNFRNDSFVDLPHIELID